MKRFLLTRDACSWACVLVLLFLPSASVASSVVGRVINRSQNRTSAGDDVVLYGIGQTMYEIARTRTGPDGSFQFENPTNSSYLVAAFHQGVSYHTKTLRGDGPVELTVYDAAQKVADILDGSHTLFVRPADRDVNITEFVSISNQSNPPRTLSGTQTFKLVLPERAILDSTAMQPPGTLPLRVKASACGRQNQYCVSYPMRPGTTRLRAVYHLQQPSTAWIALPPRLGAGRVAVMVAHSLELTGKLAGTFEKQETEGGMSMYVANKGAIGAVLLFRLSKADPNTVEPKLSSTPVVFGTPSSFRATEFTLPPARGRAPSQISMASISKASLAFLVSLALIMTIGAGANRYARNFAAGDRA
ncbi:MAG: hypothetical protein HY010_11015 [Acidobacteria bacterium]|nr:hypothetical protein [Acidobacteriota bacterium]